MIFRTFITDQLIKQGTNENLLNKKAIVTRLFVCLFCCFMSQVNSYGHGEMVQLLDLNMWKFIFQQNEFFNFLG